MFRVTPPRFRPLHLVGETTGGGERPWCVNESLPLEGCDTISRRVNSSLLLNLSAIDRRKLLLPPNLRVNFEILEI